MVILLLSTIYISLSCLILEKVHCLTNPCSNGAECIEILPSVEHPEGGYKCGCKSGFMGTTCEGMCFVLFGVWWFDNKQLTSLWSSDKDTTIIIQQLFERYFLV